LGAAQLVDVCVVEFAGSVLLSFLFSWINKAKSLASHFFSLDCQKIRPLN